MNILVIPSWYPNGLDQLMGIYHKEFCEALAIIKNVTVNMLFIERERLNNPLKFLFMPKHKKINEKNYHIYITRMLNRERISYKWQMHRYVKVLNKAFKKYLKHHPKPDIIHAMVTLPAGYAACVLGKKYNIPVVITEHASYAKTLFEGKNKPFGLYALNNAQYFTTVSKYMLEEIPNSNTPKDVLPNLVDTNFFKLPHKKVSGLKLIQVCAFRKGKRIEDMLKALKLIVDKKEIKEISLTIVGDGYLKDYYQNTCHELGLDAYVNFVGRKTKKEIATILNEHNIFVITSDKETFCIPGIEALASGMPIVSTKCLGPEEYIDEKNGKLINVGDIEALANAIIEVYKNLDQYDISYLRATAERYSPKNITNKALKIYKEIIKNKEV